MKRASLLLFLTAACFFAGCQTAGEFQNVWRRADYFGGPKASVAVVALAYTPQSRRFVEDTFANALRAHGVRAQTTFGYLPVQEIFDDEPSAVQKIRGLGVDAVLAVRLADPGTLRAIQISPGNPSSLQPWQNWYDFFDVKGAFATGPEQVRVGKEIGMQATFYEAPEGKLLWSATLLPTVRGDDNQVRELAEQIAAKLQESALIF